MTFGDQFTQLPLKDQFDLSPEALSGQDYRHTDGCVMLIDADTERHMELGTSWPFEPLQPGECLLSSAFAKTLQSEVGDTLLMKIPMQVLLDSIRDEFNQVASEQNMQTLSANVEGDLEIPCRIAGFLEE
jgi:hypothetical protein